jgi:hypothetical protein
MLALIAGYLHMHLLVELHGPAGLGCNADAFDVGGRDDRRCVDNAAG